MTRRHEKVLNREDGSTVRLVAEYCPSFFTKPSINYYAFIQPKGSKEWKLFTPHSSPDKSLNGLSVDEYFKRGRKGLLSIVTPAEILKAGMELHEELRLNF